MTKIFCDFPPMYWQTEHNIAIATIMINKLILKITMKA